MARAHLVSKANKNIYENGKRVTYTSKKGKRIGEQKSKLDRTIPANDSDKILIAKGESYYWWKFKNSEKSFSKTRPKNSQLTRSGYLSQLYNLQDRLSDIRGNVSEADDLSSAVDDIKSDLESLKEECEGSLENMPEHLQESSSSGELLHERIDSLDNAISELEGIDCEDYEEPDKDELRTEAIEELQLDEDDEETLQDRETEINDAMERIKEEKLSDWLDEKCEEINGVELG